MSNAAERTVTISVSNYAQTGTTKVIAMTPKEYAILTEAALQAKPPNNGRGTGGPNVIGAQVDEIELALTRLREYYPSIASGRNWRQDPMLPMLFQGARGATF